MRKVVVYFLLSVVANVVCGDESSESDSQLIYAPCHEESVVPKKNGKRNQKKYIFSHMKYQFSMVKFLRI